MSVSPPPLYSRRELVRWTRYILREHGIRPREKLGQSFLVEPRVIREIGYWLSKLGIQRSMKIIEIGPGLGVITYYILGRRLNVVGIELDHRLVTVLHRILGGNIFFTLIHGDALHIPFLGEVVVSNVPFYISSELLVKIARENNVAGAILILQKDVVNRIAARPGTRDYGRLSVLLQLLFDIRPGGVYGRKCFYPEPDVDARVVVLVRRNMYTGIHSVIENLTRLVFTERRKKALTVISRKTGLDKKVLLNLGINEDTRVYQISPSTFLDIALKLSQEVGCSNGGAR